MSTIMTAAAWAALLGCAALAASGLRLMARTEGGWREAPMWDGPLFFSSAAFALLAFLGFLPPVLGAFLVLVPLLIITATAAKAWRALAAKDGKGAATRWVLGGIAGHVKDSLWHAREDLRDATTARRRGDDQPESEPILWGTRPSSAPATRQVPPLRADAALGDRPAPTAVSAGLEASGATVPRAWAVLADWIADFEPEDEDDLMGFMADLAVGTLTVASAVEAFAENLGTGAGIDPGYITGLFELGDEFAELAASAVMVHRRYHVIYDGVHQHVDDGGTLPYDSRGWFGAGGAPEAA